MPHAEVGAGEAGVQRSDHVGEGEARQALEELLLHLLVVERVGVGLHRAADVGAAEVEDRHRRVQALLGAIALEAHPAHREGGGAGAVLAV